MMRRIFLRQFGVGRPQNPTMDESFGTKFSDSEVKKIMDPKGFIDEREYKDYDGIDAIGKKPEDQAKVDTGKDVKVEVATEKDNKEYGFRIKGPEPTRYGDWERNGRCIDF
jgi:hypothetical protein